MKKFFSRNGVSIPSIGLGTWDLRHKEGEDVIKLAIEAGYRHIDTAQMYENEEAAGNGGGYGNPEERDKKLIEDDLLNEYITPEQAQKYYKYKQ